MKAYLYNNKRTAGDWLRLRSPQTAKWYVAEIPIGISWRPIFEAWVNVETVFNQVGVAQMTDDYFIGRERRAVKRI